MEKNGGILDQELLDKWIVESQRKYHEGIMQLYRETGLRVNPGSTPDIARLFKKLGLPITELTEKGNPSFPDDYLKTFSHPTIVLLRHTKKLGSLHSKLRKYRESIDDNGILRYAMHQLRASKSESGDSGETGTIVGRFTSTEITPGFGVNIQQVLKPEKQFRDFGDEFFIRNLFLSSTGRYLSADAEQIQYRIAAHMAQNPKVLAMYKQDPWMSFHKMVLAMLREYKPDIAYKRCKDLNFAKMFVAGPTKLAFMLNEITKREMMELRLQKANRHHPKLRGTVEVLKVYERAMPEMDQLSKKAMGQAQEQGFVESILGRRMRFPTGDRIYKAFNGIVIMSEADIVKTKLIEVHEARKETGFLLRAQVHDEVDGDILEDDTEQKISEILNRQSFPGLSVPILWGVSSGNSWGDCSREELAELREAAKK
jgi:DNA polymerase I-like protein with 3'-5' exonuclease and polymerase domains